MSALAPRLARAVRDDAARAGVAVTLAPLASQPWCAALFRGETHATVLEASDDATTAAWLATLPDAALRVPRQTVEVAVDDIACAAGRLRATLHLLSIED